MNRIIFRSLFEELESIEKDAGIKDVMKVIGKAKTTASDKAKKLTTQLTTHPKVKKVVDYVSDPTNIADLSHSVANITNRFV